MILTKLKSTHTNGFEYLNMDNIQHVEVHHDHYCVCLSSGVEVKIDLTDTTLSGLVSDADTAYGV